MDIILKWHILDYNNERFVDITIKWHIWKYDNDRFVVITLKWHIWHFNNEIYIVDIVGMAVTINMDLIRHSLYCGHGELTHLVVPRTCFFGNYIPKCT